MGAIELRNITKTFGKHLAVNNLSLAVPSGSVYGFIGPNGSGKTTTLRMIMNIIPPDSGEILVLGSHVSAASTDRVGYMPEERGLYRRMKVKELLQFFGSLKSENHVKARVDQWLQRLDLTEWANKKVETLSKGMAQKVQFIATVVSQPELVLLDEPFTGLDPVNTDVIKDAILELHAQGTTVIFSTHDMSMAEKMCDFIFMIFKGNKVLDGTLSSIQDNYGTDTLRVRTGNGVSALQNLPGIDKINDFGQLQELHLAPHGDPQKILQEILMRTTVQSFDITRPSLHDIFIRIARPEAKEVSHA
ncbi:MAG: ATP-binding cassette domain-containing protein [bacterium]